MKWNGREIIFIVYTKNGKPTTQTHTWNCNVHGLTATTNIQIEFNQRIDWEWTTKHGTLFLDLIDILLIPKWTATISICKNQKFRPHQMIFRLCSQSACLPFLKFTECAIFSGKNRGLFAIDYSSSSAILLTLIAFHQRARFIISNQKKRQEKKIAHNIVEWMIQTRKKNQVLKLPTLTSLFFFFGKKNQQSEKEKKKILFIVFSWVNSSSSFNWHFYLWHIQSEISIICRRFDHCKNGFFKLISFFCTVHTMFWCAVFVHYILYIHYARLSFELLQINFSIKKFQVNHFTIIYN